MVLGRLTHYAFDLVAVSAVVAGIKKTTGFTPNTELIPDSSLKSVANSYFSVGETVFNVASGSAVSSSWFRKT